MVPFLRDKSLHFQRNKERILPMTTLAQREATLLFVQICVFIAMSTVVFLGFAQSFFLGFYVSNEGFQTLAEALVSMVRFSSGDVDFEALKRTNTVLAPTLYCLALFVLGFVWTSLLLAIVINAYYDEVNDVRPCLPFSFSFGRVFYKIVSFSGCCNHLSFIHMYLTGVTCWTAPLLQSVAYP
jgi:Polycystin cation channel